MPAKPMNKNRFVPSFESLESRDMMSVTSVWLDPQGGLLIGCGPGNNNVNISAPSAVASASQQLAPVASSGPPSSSGVKAMASLAPNSNATYLFDSIVVKDLTKTTNNVWTFARSAVKRIEVDATTGDNTIISTVSLPTDVNAGDGKNNIQTGAGKDFIHLGNGNNIVATNDGDDFVQVGFGNNIINGGNGNDTLYAGNGVNQIFGGAGDDLIRDFASDTHPNTGSLLYGQDGNDTIISTNRNDVVDGGAGYDSLNVKAGTFVVRNGENVTIDVPTGQTTNSDQGSAVNAGTTLLRAYGYNPRVSVILTDSNFGLPPDQLAALLRRTDPSITLLPNANVDAVSHIQHVINLVESGKPVLLAISGPNFHRYVVVNGYDSTTQTFKYIDNGVQQTMSASDLNAYWGAAFAGSSQRWSLIY